MPSAILCASLGRHTPFPCPLPPLPSLPPSPPSIPVHDRSQAVGDGSYVVLSSAVWDPAGLARSWRSAATELLPPPPPSGGGAVLDLFGTGVDYLLPTLVGLAVGMAALAAAGLALLLYRRRRRAGKGGGQRALCGDCLFPMTEGADSAGGVTDRDKREESPPPMPSEPDRGAAVARKEEAVAVAAVEADAGTCEAGGGGAAVEAAVALPPAPHSPLTGVLSPSLYHRSPEARAKRQPPLPSAGRDLIARKTFLVVRAQPYQPHASLLHAR